MDFIKIDQSYLCQMKELYKSAFKGEPWNDDWSDEKQLDLYMREVCGGFNALNFGLVEDGNLLALSAGRVSHWWEGTNYAIEKLCVSPKMQGKGIGSQFMKIIEAEVKKLGLSGIFLQTDIDKPAFSFYTKNGFSNLEKHASLYKSVK